MTRADVIDLESRTRDSINEQIGIQRGLAQAARAEAEYCETRAMECRDAERGHEHKADELRSKLRRLES